MTKVTKQSGAASSTPSVVKRWLLSTMLTRMIDENRRARQRHKAEARRRKEGRPHVVEYFHQVDDGYAHLAIQTLAKLRARYDIDIVVYVVSALKDDNIPEPDLLQEMSRWDASTIAPYYGLDFPAADAVPSKELAALACAVLCRMDADQVVTDGPRVSECLWRRDEAGLKSLAAEFGASPQATVDAKLAAGDKRRAKLKHYSGAMFWYEGEWYWGVDRLSHLERRLSALGAIKDSAGQQLVAPKPAVASCFPDGARDMTLEYYPSLRSPYTAVSWEPTMALVERSGIKFVMRPILPMVMRGVPATFNKGFYIWKDAAREARDFGVDYGNFYDPIGEPIKQGYSLYMWACERGKGNDFFGAFLKAAFARGINTTRRSGMRKVVEMAGLDWSEAQHHLHDDSWQDVLEENRASMYRCGIWGVPSYRLLDRDGRQVLGVWGQDRLWLVSRKIQEHACPEQVGPDHVCQEHAGEQPACQEHV